METNTDKATIIFVSTVIYLVIISLIFKNELVIGIWAIWTLGALFIFTDYKKPKKCKIDYANKETG